MEEPVHPLHALPSLESSRLHGDREGLWLLLLKEPQTPQAPQPRPKGSFLMATGLQTSAALTSTWFEGTGWGGKAGVPPDQLVQGLGSLRANPECPQPPPPELGGFFLPGPVFLSIKWR